MLASICIFDRSLARTNSVGEDMVADTVWPISTLRAITTPSIGARMMVFDRLTSAVSTAARAWRTLASALAACAAAVRLAKSADLVRRRFVAGEELSSPTARR